MTAVLWPLTILLALLIGALAGYVFALRQTPATLAKCTPEQLAVLAKRTAARRKVA